MEQKELPADLFAQARPLPQAYAWLPLGAVRPRGWIEAQLRRDLEAGFVGRLDELAPELIGGDDIYGSARLTRAVARKDLGVSGHEADWQVQYLWWNSETQSNWRDGMVRTALLLDHPEYMPRVRDYIERILATQDEDGYLGIYAPDLRYSATGENGELWAQSSLFRVLLGYYEATGEERVLHAVERAVRRTMAAFPMGASRPFAQPNSYAGVSHGLTFTDTLDRLAQLTGEHAYAQYALWLYQEYSGSQVSEADICYPNLLDPDYRFEGHGVHTYEHLRALLAALYASGSPLLEEALAAYLAKLEPCLTPSGGPIGDEWIEGRAAEPGETGYEYCSIHELLDSYSHLLQKTGAPLWGDRAEWLLFNAGQGARHPEECAIAYLKTDSSTAMVGTLHPGDPQDPARPQNRYKYSPVHQDVAVCCVPNAGRIYPYFVKAMWMRSPTGLVATLYGPCEVRTRVGDVAVRIVEETAYPFDLAISLTLEVERPVDFELALRRPAWAEGWACAVNDEAAGAERDGLIVLRRTWRSGDRVTLSFSAGVQVGRAANGEATVSYGPLLFVRPIGAEGRAVRQYPLAGFVDRYYEPIPAELGAYRLAPRHSEALRLVRGPFDPERPWAGSLKIAATLERPQSGEEAALELRPIGGTILRQATFPD